jgi:hypothetical protein
VSQKSRNTLKCKRPTCQGNAINGGRNRGLCRNHHREFTRRRRAALGPDWIVDTAPASAHIAALRAAGVGYRHISEIAGLNSETVSNIARRRTQRTTAEVAGKILAVKIPATIMSSRIRVCSVGTRRRLQALYAIGYSNVYLADRLAMSETNVSRIVHRRAQVNADVAARVAELFQELQMTPAPNVRARNRAAANGWPPPLAWDEDTIDDPAATSAVTPLLGAVGAFLDRYRDAREIGHDDAAIAEMLGIKPKSLHRRLIRYGYREAS